MKRTLLVVTAALAGALPGCGTFYAEAEQPMVCLTMLPQTFSVPGGGTVAPPGGFTGSSSGVVDLGLSDALPDFILTGQSQDRILRFLSFQATVSGPPGANLDFLTGLRVTAQGPPGSVPVELANYSRGTPTGRIITAISMNPTSPDNNLTDLLASGGLTFNVTGSVAIPAGQPIPGTWSATVSSCFYAKIRKTFQEMIDGAK
jgi:hypothetical protein